MFSFKSNRLRSGSGTNKHTVWAVTHIMGPIICVLVYMPIYKLLVEHTRLIAGQEDLGVKCKELYVKVKINI